MTDRILAICDDYLGLVAALRARVAELGVAVGGENAAELSGLSVGHLAKLLTPQRSGKRFGLISLGPVLGLLGLKLHLVEDAEQTRRMIARIERRNGVYVRNHEIQFAIPKKHFAEMGSKGAKAGHAKRTPSQRKTLAKRLNRARWARVRNVAAETTTNAETPTEETPK